MKLIIRVEIWNGLIEWMSELGGLNPLTTSLCRNEISEMIGFYDGRRKRSCGTDTNLVMVPNRWLEF